MMDRELPRYPPRWPPHMATVHGNRTWQLRMAATRGSGPLIESLIPGRTEASPAAYHPVMMIAQRPCAPSQENRRGTGREKKETRTACTHMLLKEEKYTFKDDSTFSCRDYALMP